MKITNLRKPIEEESIFKASYSVDGADPQTLVTLGKAHCYNTGCRFTTATLDQIITESCFACAVPVFIGRMTGQCTLKQDTFEKPKMLREEEGQAAAAGPHLVMAAS